MKRLILFFALVCAILSGFSQQELGLYFMPGAVQSQRYNPAFLQEEKVNLSLASIGMGVAHTGFSFGDIIFPVPGSTETQLNVESALRVMDEQNHFRFQTSVDVLNLSVRLRGLQIGFGYQAKADALLQYPKTLAQLAWGGNTQFVGNEINIAPSFQIQGYHEFSLSAGWKVGRIFQGGLRMKYLVGLANLSTANQDATIFTDANNYATTVSTDYVIQSSMIDMGSPEAFAVSISPQAFTQNTGYGIDAGAVIQLTKKLSIAISGVNILSNINWQDSVSQFTSRGTYTFSGLDAAEAITGGEIETESVLDSISSRLEFTETNDPYITQVPTQIYASAHFQPINTFRLGALIFQEWYRGRQFPGMMLSANKDLGKIVTAGLTYSMRTRSFDNLGANVLLRGGPVVMFLVTDNFTALLTPRSAREINFRWGMNIAIK
ncbi:MAG: DUF5723 family protein [Bacteroidota bacterium]